jgi:hypothetical protein
VNANALNFDLFAFAQPKSRGDIIALAMEARAEFARINAHLDALFERLECCAEV